MSQAAWSFYFLLLLEGHITFQQELLWLAKSSLLPKTVPAPGSTGAQIHFAPYFTEICGAKVRVCRTCYLCVKNSIEVKPGAVDSSCWSYWLVFALEKYQRGKKEIAPVRKYSTTLITWNLSVNSWCLKRMCECVVHYTVTKMWEYENLNLWLGEEDLWGCHEELEKV